MATGGMTLIIGLAFTFFPQIIISFLGYIMGGVLIFLGIINVILYFKRDVQEGYSFGFAIGLILFSMGLYFSINTEFILNTMTVLFGFYILINGIMGLQFSLDSYRALTNSWKFTIGMALVNLILGGVILYNPFKSTEVLVMYIGIFMTITAILSMVTVLINKKYHLESNK